jgi:methyl-accepting chemotaxis protein
MTESQIYNEHFVEKIEMTLSQLVEGMTALIQSQCQIMEKLSKHSHSTIDDTLEIMTSLEDIEHKIDNISKDIANQEENTDEIKVDIEDLKNYIVLVQAVKGIK